MKRRREETGGGRNRLRTMEDLVIRCLFMISPLCMEPKRSAREARKCGARAVRYRASLDRSSRQTRWRGYRNQRGRGWAGGGGLRSWQTDRRRGTHCVWIIHEPSCGTAARDRDDRRGFRVASPVTDKSRCESFPCELPCFATRTLEWVRDVARAKAISEFRNAIQSRGLRKAAHCSGSPEMLRYSSGSRWSDETLEERGKSTGAREREAISKHVAIAIMSRREREACRAMFVRCRETPNPFRLSQYRYEGRMRGGIGREASFSAFIIPFAVRLLRGEKRKRKRGRKRNYSSLRPYNEPHARRRDSRLARENTCMPGHYPFASLVTLC